MSIADYAERKILDHVLGVGSAWRPTARYLSLHTDNPNEGGANELTGGSYVRQAITFSAATTDGTTNVTTAAASVGGGIDFTDLPAATVSHLAIWDDETGGNCLWTGACSPVRNLLAGDSLRITAVSVTLD